MNEVILIFILTSFNYIPEQSTFIKSEEIMIAEEFKTAEECNNAIDVFLNNNAGGIPKELKEIRCIYKSKFKNLDFFREMKTNPLEREA